MMGVVAFVRRALAAEMKSRQSNAFHLAMRIKSVAQLMTGVVAFARRALAAEMKSRQSNASHPATTIKFVVCLMMGVVASARWALAAKMGSRQVNHCGVALAASLQSVASRGSAIRVMETSSSILGPRTRSGTAKPVDERPRSS